MGLVLRDGHLVVGMQKTQGITNFSWPSIQWSQATQFESTQVDEVDSSFVAVQCLASDLVGFACLPTLYSLKAKPEPNPKAPGSGSGLRMRNIIDNLGTGNIDVGEGWAGLRLGSGMGGEGGWGNGG